MFKNIASQSVTLSAVDATTGLPKTGDSANMTFYVSKDDGSVVAIAASSGVPTEADATNAKGDYKIALAQAETNADKLRFSGKSSTANVVVISQTIYTVPANFTTAAIGSGGNIGADVQTVKTQTVTCSAAITVSPNVGTTQPLNFTGTAGSALVKGDAIDIGSTAQTGRDIGASVLISAGTGTGQLDFTAGVVKANLVQILATALTETAGQIAAAFKQFFNIASPTSTMNAITLVTTTTTATNLTTLPAVPTDWLTAAGVKADAVTKIEAGLATPTNITAGTITNATNVTNAPTAGDFTAAMKTSLSAATPTIAATQSFNNTGQTANVPANTKQFLGQAVVLDSNNYPGINVVDVAGLTAGAAPSLVQGAVVTASTTSAVIVSGLASGLSFVGQKLYVYATSEARIIATQSYSSPHYTFGFTGTSGTDAGPFSTPSIATDNVVSTTP